MTAPPLPAPPPHQDTALAREQPRVHGARGPLPPQQASRILRRLERESDSDLLSRHLRAVEDLIDAPLRVGNAAELLIDGPATHKAMLGAIEQARDHVNLETYIIDADAVGQRTADLLLRKRSEGVQVNLIYDSVGALGTPPEYFERLRQAGVRVCEYNPVNPLKARGAWRINNRDHRKLLVVDGEVAFAGGINISGVYSSGSFSKRRRKPPVEDGWRDTHIEVRGPVVTDVQRLFLETWAKQCGEIDAADYFPRLRVEGSKVMRVVAGEPGESEIYPALLSAIERAERKVYLTVGYFVPDPRTLAVLLQAARRGVDVRLALPGVSDFWAPLYAGRSHYEALLAAGVRIFERRDALLHAKTAVIDGVWSTVGSTNVDWRSFVHNAEANLIVLGEDFGERMEALFARDLEHSVEISEERWRRRGPGTRFKEWLARRWEYFL
ncbi:MAG TPA: phospholipase D-like domain-containing protein [Burkholderiales bacterium]|nr:phospholipase D-like domain-containing protein [Burkholderiales bacterium]